MGIFLTWVQRVFRVLRKKGRLEIEGENKLEQRQADKMLHKGNRHWSESRSSSFFPWTILPVGKLKIPAFSSFQTTAFRSFDSLVTLFPVRIFWEFWRFAFWWQWHLSGPR